MLDAGAGTGLIGGYLKAMGFNNLTAIDLSERMLQHARTRGCYRELRRMALGEALDFPNDAFDHGYAVGVFTEGHAPPESFDEIIRVIRPGGCFVFSIRDDVYRHRGYRERQDQLENDGRWSQLAASPIFQPYPDSKPSVQSRVFVYQAS